MVKGYEQNQARVQALSLLGKDLARRAARRCELCETAGAGYSTFEVAPVPKEPDLDHCLLVCDNCRQQLTTKGKPDSRYWHFLETAAWGELPAVQVTAVRLMRQMEDADWARQLLETLYLSPEAELWLQKPL